MKNPRTVILSRFRKKDFLAKMQADSILEVLYPYFSKEVQEKFFTEQKEQKETV